MLPLFALYHNLLNFVLPLCSSLERPRPEVPVTNSTNIVDIQGVSLRQFWNLKNHMQDASVLATAHYPETLDRIFIIGAPNFFPTVWGWIKRWFDPVTVSKIFILSKAEVKPTLEKFMDASSIPKKYGGTLEWAWGDAPHLDQETREALEQDGHKGWVKGPALWLDNERVVVGSDNGKLRRSDKEIAEKKPIIYAADYTEVPVHPEKRLSVVSGGKTSLDIRTDSNTKANTGAMDLPSPLPESPSTLVEDKQLGAAALAAPVTAAAATATTTTTTEAKPATPTKQQIPADMPLETVRTSPFGDSQVHIPKDQPAAPATTVEYIRSTEQVNSVSPPVQQANPPSADAATASDKKVTKDSLSHAEAATAAVTAATTTVPAHSPSSHEMTTVPAGHTQPGPLPAHTAELNRMIAHKLEGESTITIPATANGILPHPDIVSTSDISKGLALDADKMPMNEKHAIERPQAERFVTAVEVPKA